MKICCFIGHRKINFTDELHEKLVKTIESLIEKGVKTFLFGSRSQFNDFCLGVVTDLKAKYPSIKRVYVRADSEYIDTDYENYLLNQYEKTYFAQSAHDAGKLVYIKRNQEMIDKSDVCIFYYDKADGLSEKGQKTSGTKRAFEYAVKRKKEVVNVFKTE